MDEQIVPIDEYEDMLDDEDEEGINEENKSG